MSTTSSATPTGVHWTPGWPVTRIKRPRFAPGNRMPSNCGRRSGALLQPANPALDPAMIRQRRKRQTQRHLASAAVLLMAVGIGGFSGWQAREMTLVRPSLLPMTDALQAYRLIAQQGMLPADYKVADNGDMQRWLDRYFARASRLPDLTAAGFQPVSGRLLSTDEGPAAMVIYEDGGGHKVSFYVRPPGPKNTFCHGAAAVTGICRPNTGRAAGTTMRWSARSTHRSPHCSSSPNPSENAEKPVGADLLAMASDQPHFLLHRRNPCLLRTPRRAPRCPHTSPLAAWPGRCRSSRCN